MDNQDWRLCSVFVRGRDVHINHSFFAHRLLVWLQRRVVAFENLARCQRHGKFERLTLGIALVRQVRIQFVLRADLILAVALRARFRNSSTRSSRCRDSQAHKTYSQKTISENTSKEFV